MKVILTLTKHIKYLKYFEIFSTNFRETSNF